MARIKIDFPEKVLFQTTLIVGIRDINYGGHVGNDRILAFMQEGRLNFFKSLGFQDEVNLRDDIGIIVADAAVMYKAESFPGEAIKIEIACNGCHKYGFDMYYRLTREDQIIALGKTGIVCMNYKTRKITPIPDELKGKLGI